MGADQVARLLRSVLQAIRNSRFLKALSAAAKYCLRRCTLSNSCRFDFGMPRKLQVATSAADAAGPSSSRQPASAMSSGEVWEAPTKPWGEDPESPVARNSPFRQGRNVIETAQTGPIGKFHRALLLLGPDIDLKEFCLPRLICIGNQSTGKSSLLENITKCPIFPRGMEMTTRAPVCLRLERVGSTQQAVTEVSFGSLFAATLSNENNIVDAVKTCMDMIPAGEIKDQPIVVRICKPDIPTMEIYDLPGIKETPEEAERITKEIVRKYLTGENTLALCVVDAQFADLTSSQAVGAVIRHKKEAETIVTLTKADLLNSTTIERQLVHRVLKKTREEIGQFAGCVAVINRSLRDSKNLVEANQDEIQTFEAKVFSNMPQKMKQYEAAMRGSIGIENLIREVEQLYCTYVKNVWKGKAIVILNGLLGKAEQAVNALGDAPGPKLSAAQVMQHAEGFINYDRLARSFLVDDQRNVQLQISLPAQHAMTNGHQARCYLTNAASWLDLKAYGSIEHAEQMLDLSQLVTSAIDAWLAKAPYMAYIAAAISAAFAQKSPMHLERFEGLQLVITQHSLLQLIQPEKIRQQLMQDIAPQLSLLRLDFSRAMPVAGLLTRLDEAIRVGVVQQAILPLKRGGFQQCLPPGFVLEESESYKAKRQQAETYQKNLKRAMEIIENIEKDIDGPAQTRSPPRVGMENWRSFQ